MLKKITKNSLSNIIRNLKDNDDNEDKGEGEKYLGTEKYNSLDESEKISTCSKVCQNGIKDSYYQRMKKQGRVFEDCEKIDGGTLCAYNFSITTDELKSMNEDRLDVDTKYVSYDLSKDLDIDVKRKNKESQHELSKKKVEITKECIKKKEDIKLKIEIEQKSYDKRLTKKKEALKYGVQRSVDNILGGFGEKFTNVGCEIENKYVTYSIIIFIIYYLSYSLCNFIRNRQ